MNESNTLVVRALVALPAALFWLLYFLPSGSGENWYRVIAWLFAAPVSLICAGVCLYFAIKAKRDLVWWLLAVWCILPAIWIGADLGGSQK